MITEDEFISQIDCRFPYHDRTEAHRLIELGCSISPNAAFALVHELARIPANTSVSSEVRIGLLQEIDARLTHPLKVLVLGIAQRLINERYLSLHEILSGMQEVADFPHQYNALNTIYFAGEDAWKEVDALYEKILREWSHAA